MSKKIKVAPPPAPTENELESEKLELSAASVEEEANKKLSPTTIRIIKKIAYYVGKEGLPLKEACFLVDVDHKRFLESMKLEPLIKKIIDMKELEYKKDMIHVVNQKARGGDEKLAMWLLERKFPEEFGEKKKNTGDGSDMIFEAIRFIRKNGDVKPLVSLDGGSPVVVKENSTTGLIERVDDILGRSHQLGQ